MNKLDKVVFALLCALIFWLPIPLGSYRVWAIMFFGFMVGSTFILHLANCAYSKQAIFPDKSSWPLMASLLAVIAVLSIQLLPTSAQSIDPNQTFVMLLKTVTMLMFAWLILLYVNNKDRIKTLIYWLVAAGVCQALYGTYLTLSPEKVSLIFGFKHDPRAMGSFTYQNFLANYLNLCLAMGIGLLISQMKINKHPLPIKQLIIDILESLLSNKIILRLCLIIIVCGLVLTKSRMGNIAFFSALAIISLYGFFFYKNKPQQLKLLIVSFFVLDLVIVGGLIGIGEVKDRLSNTSFVEETRDEVYRDSILIILDKPILGSGGGSFYTAFPAYQSEVILGHYDNAHNDYIQFAAELGLPVSILLGCLLIYLLFLCLNIISTSNCNFQKGIAFGCITSILMMLIHSTVDYSLQSGANSITFIAILATLLNVSKLKSDVKKRRRQ